MREKGRESACLCMNVCVCVRACVRACVREHVCMRTCVRACVRMWVYALASMSRVSEIQTEDHITPKSCKICLWALKPCLAVERETEEISLGKKQIQQKHVVALHSNTLQILNITIKG